MDKISNSLSDDEKDTHVRYLELWKMLKTEDKDISLMFDDIKRSNAIRKLARWRYNNLITDGDLVSFSLETLNVVNAFLEAWR